MITFSKDEKKLVIPSALGNFGNAGGGSGSGLTPEEVAEIASAVTEAAIEEYDTEIQVDLEEIRDAISGNTDTLLDLAVIAAMSVADRVALFDEVFEKASNGERIYIKGLVQEETVRTAVLPLVSYRPETNPVLHQGGNLYFAAKGDTDNIYFHIGLTSEGSIDPTSGNIIKRNIYNLPTASAEVKGGVRIGSGFTMAQDVISVDTTGLVTDGDLAPFVAELSAATGDLAALSGSVNDIRSDVGTLSGATSDILSDIEALSGITESVSAAVDTLSGITEGKQDALTAGKGIFISGNTISSEIEYFEVADYSNFQTLYNDLYSAYTAGKKLILVGTDSSFPSSRDIEIWLDFAEWRNNKFTFAAITKYLIGTQDTYKKIRSYYVTISSNGSVTGMLNGRFTNVWEFGEYSLSAATSTALGGIKVGSGLSMGSDDKLSVNIGEGLAFSGNTLVVSGISGGGGNVFVITDVYGDVSDLSDFLFQYRDAGTGGMTSGYPGDTHILLWLGQDWMGALDPHGQGYIELFPISSYEEEGIYIIELVGVYADNSGTGYAIKIGVTDGGTTRGNSANPLMNLPREIPQPSFVRFGNDGRGGLTYDADNNRFEYDSGYITPGDTSTVYPDLIDKLFTDYLVDGGMVFDYLLPVNLNRLSVIESGETREYAYPSLSRRDLPSTVTIDGVDFNKEITYYYGEWKLTAYYGGNDGNEAANVRISRL